jgi:hypothetical protein
MVVAQERQMLQMVLMLMPTKVVAVGEVEAVILQEAIMQQVMVALV